MRRSSLVLASLLAPLVAATSVYAFPPAEVGTGAPTAASAAGVSWADAQIRVVTALGVLGDDPATFRPAAPLTRGELNAALVAIGKHPAAPLDPAKLVTIRGLDAQLVGALGLVPAARRFRIAARDAGLAPSSILGTETVARLIGLRLNHPQADEALELLPSQPATRAEAAYSFARVLQLGPEETARVDERSQAFAIPVLTDWQRTILTRALRFVGYPYVFAGTSEKVQQLWSATSPGGIVTVPGGFDCSGFVWRVYKTRPFAAAPLLGESLKGRTTYAMSGEVEKPARIPLADLQPGDVVFFGSRGALSTPAQVGHMGIYVGSGWFVHSSEAGVTLHLLEGWYATRFAWARRPLAEAGLTA